MAGINRLAELRGAGDFAEEPPDTQSNNANADISKYAAMFEPIKRNIDVITNNVEEIKKLKDKDRSIANEKSRKEIMDKLDRIMSETTRKAREIKNDLDAIDQLNKKYNQENTNTATAQARKNMYDARMRQLNKIMTEYNSASHEFKHELQLRTRRQLKIVDSNISEDEIDKIVTSGRASDFIAKALISEDLKEVVRDIEERHNDILKLESQVLEVYELFKDLAMLVEQQQESLDHIQNRIESAQDYVQKGEKQLEQAATHQKKARKKMICILGILLIVLICILAPVLSSALGNS
mmetsp:Transcript_23088/g.32571  ORF Transcript_23088/g.32571 Transcript_23088/m.32571 type:complete len:295 (+) Transcript_23088:25-909(+)|eukprot:CAMPEP_0175091466 /NCGR_PEP_ID=MMETSP0086_2-20121207/1915_1 /TAXON_ID=136419 /ORGANISM="Unknown Unknown, Strain D1" /LENGTH=294 /DNA_ID=CAMNT_0016364205 /DNA_START=22 /DNA_END=906 /DNA_ORIENTATION=-